MSDRHLPSHALILAAVLAAALVAGAAHHGEAQQHRQLGAHQHGHGRLDVAIEGNTLQAELEVPGADIVGFEHPATTDADKRKIAAARKELADPASLLAVPAQAGCRLTSAKVAIEGEEDSAHHEQKHAGHEGEAIHSEFHVVFAFDCASVTAITQINFPYFKKFPKAQELDVTLITNKGQKTFEVNRKTMRVDVRDML